MYLSWLFIILIIVILIAFVYILILKYSNVDVTDNNYTNHSYASVNNEAKHSVRKSDNNNDSTSNCLPCGTSSFYQSGTSFQCRLLNKNEAKPHSCPCIVSMQTRTDADGFVHKSAGIIIGRRLVLTAGHCCLEEDPNSIYLVAGCHDLKGDEGTIQRRFISGFKIHDIYVGGTNPYDLALIITDEPFIYNDFVQPASLPMRDLKSKDLTSFFGFGSMTADGEIYPDKLQEAVLSIIDLKRCEEKVAFPPYRQLNKTNVCAESFSGDLSICHGDSGGPLMQGYTVVGVASWSGKPCGTQPSVFSDVFAHKEWIQETISKFLQDKSVRPDALVTFNDTKQIDDASNTPDNMWMVASNLTKFAI